MSNSKSVQPSTEEGGHAHALQSRDIDQFVDHFLSLMCDSSRRHILELLAAVGERNAEATPPEKRSTDIAKALGLSPATTSGHLRQLFQARLVTSRREGNTIYYRLSNSLLLSTFHELVAALHQEYSGGKNSPNAEAESS